jgi:acyl dehydratase
MAVDTSVIGKPTGAYRVRVERGPVEFFASAVKDANPVYHDPAAAKAAGFDGIPAPPTF